MGTAAEAAGTLLGHVAEGETLAGWEIVAVGNGAAITMKSGSCWGRYEGECTADEGWDAVTARLWGRMSDVDVGESLRERRREREAAERGTGRMAIVGARAAYEAVYAEAVKRGMIGEGVI